ncbi:integrin alpha FG-GAP repeat-containing protein 2 [Mortierella sp. GBA30]|nr:integrin alpha FG-GAP repeat-containing protein 2 [Mortierella sp. GBA30]
MATNAAQAREQAMALTQQYSPWCLLHMLLKNHKPLFSTLLLEELLPPHVFPSPLPLTSTSPSHTQSAHPQRHHQHNGQESLPVSPVPPIPAPRVSAILSRHLVQRLHLGYYGNKRVLSEPAVRYLTARARLEYGYFVIRGRAFWNINHEDVEASLRGMNLPLASVNRERDGRDKKSAAGGNVRVERGAAVVGGGDEESLLAQGLQQNHGSSQEQDQQQPLQQIQTQEGSSLEDNDIGGIKDDDPYSIAYAEAVAIVGSGLGSSIEGRTGVADQAEQRRRVVVANHHCEEREEELLMLEAVRYCERCQPVLILTFDQIPAASSTASTTMSESSERQAAAEYWRRVACTSLIDSQTDMDTEDLITIPPSPFLRRRVDSSWMKRLQKSPILSLHSNEHSDQDSLLGRMRMVQDDERLFQISSGIFDGLATYPKKWKTPIPNIIDGPLSLSLDTLKTLIFEYGYIPLPEDDQDRKAHYKGGDRVRSGDTLVFPSDGTHVVNKRGLKGRGTSIWYFYDLQRIEIMIVYLIHRIPQVLDWLFECGFELQVPSSEGVPGISPVLLLQCCIPGCHAMVRHLYKASSTDSFSMPASVAVVTVLRELLGCIRKPKRIEFRRQDFAEVLRGLPPTQISDSLNIMIDLGMEPSVLQDRFQELLRIPGGPSPVIVDKTLLSALFLKCMQASKPSLIPATQDPLCAMEDITPTSLGQADNRSNSNNDFGSTGRRARPNLLSTTDLINNTIQQTFEIQMDMSDVQDKEWRKAFEDTLLHFKQEAWIVNPRVSDWILASLDASEPAFRTCFDHALMETLLELLEWNDQQVRRLQRWCESKEMEARSRSMMGGRHPWEEVKDQVLVVRQNQERSNDRILDEDELMLEAEEESFDGTRNSIGLDIEWTTNDQIILETASTVADLPGGSEIVRLSADDYLLLDNGCLDQELLLCDQKAVDGGCSLETNKKVHEYLRKGAIVEEKHLVWLALGLVTVSFSGRRVVEVHSQPHRNNKEHYQHQHHHRHHHHHQTRREDTSIPIKMACSPEAYQLVWILASAFIRQAILLEYKQVLFGSDAAMSGTTAEHSVFRKSLEDDEGRDPSFSQSATTTAATAKPFTSASPSRSPPLSPALLPSSVFMVREMQHLLRKRLGNDAWLMVEILSEIEDDIEERVLRQTEMPSARHVSLVQKLRWHVSGNISPTAFAIGDVDGHGDNAFVIGNLVGELFIFKGNHPEGLPWLTCKGLGTITAVAIGDIRNWGKNSIVVMSAEGLCHIFDVTGMDDDSGQGAATGMNISPAATAPLGAGAGSGASRSGNTASIYSSTLQGSYQQMPGTNGSYHGQGSSPLHPSIPATPSIRPVPDVHHRHNHNHNHSHNQSNYYSHNHHSTSHPYHGTPPLPPPPHNTPHGSTSSSTSGFPQLQHHTPIATPIHSHSGSIHSISGGMRRGSEIFPGSGSGSGSAVRTSTVLANLIGTPPIPTSSSSSHGPSVAPSFHTRSVGGYSATNSPTGTPVLRPQQLPSNAVVPGLSLKDRQERQQQPLKRHNSGTRHHSVSGKSQVRNVGGRRVLERPNLTLPVPVNINRAYIADIDGDGLNELVLARTDRILHSYSLQVSKTASPNATQSNHPYNQPLSLVKLLSRTSSISTLDSSGLLSPSEDRRETVIHYPSLSSKGKQQQQQQQQQHYPTSVPAASTGISQNHTDTQDATIEQSNRLVLVEKKRWALDGQINCLSVTKDAHTGLPILLVAQPGLKFVMVDHTGQMSEPVTQAQRNSTRNSVVGPDTPTRSAGSGDVATDIVCGTRYVDGQRKDIIGLMSMDGAFALHDLESNTARVHDLDSTHKIFGFSKLNFGKDYVGRSTRESRKTRSGYGRPSRTYADENNYDELEDEDHEVRESDSEADDLLDGGKPMVQGGLSDEGEGPGRPRYFRRRKSRTAGPSFMISEPYGSRFQKNDMFVGCSWSGITFFIDQDFNTAQYDFDARVCAFGAGQYAVSPGRNEPCLFYVDFEDNIYVYYNLYIQTEPSLQFQDIVSADKSLIRKSQKFHFAEQTSGNSAADADPGSTTVCEPTLAALEDRDNYSDVNSTDNKNVKASCVWTERDMKDFIHDTLYNANRYEDEFQRLKRLASNELAKRAAILEAEANKERKREREQMEAERVATAEAVATSASGSSTYMDPRSRRPPPLLRADTFHGTDTTSGMQIQHGQYSGPKSMTDIRMTSPEYTQHEQQEQQQSPHEHPSSSSAPSSPKASQSHIERRRSSLLIKDVLSHYEGKITPPMKSPSSPTASSGEFSKGHSKTSSFSAAATAATLSIMKRLSLKDHGNGGRLSRTSTSSSDGSSDNGDGSAGGSASGGSQSTITPGHPLLGAPVLSKGKALETRVGKALRANRPVGVPRNRHLGVLGRKLGTRSRLSLQQDHDDDTEEGEDDTEQAPSDDGMVETEGDNLLEYEASSRRSIGDDEEQQVAQEEEAEIAAEEGYNRSRRRSSEPLCEEETVGVYTPSTISPIPSPGRFSGTQHGSLAEPSPSLDSSAFVLAKSLLSPSSRGNLSGNSTAATASSGTGVLGKNSRHHHTEQDSHSQSHSRSPSSVSRGHMRQRSSHGLLDVGLGLLPTRDVPNQSSGLGSGPNSAGHSSVQDGRRSRAESVLSTGSDIGGVIVPDITLLASSFPTQSSVQLSTSEPLSHGAMMSDDDEDENDEDDINDDDVNFAPSDDIDLEDQNQRATVIRGPGVRRPPKRSATLGSQDSVMQGVGSGSGITNVKASSQKSSPSTGEGTGVDVKLLPAPLPRSKQHYQRQQLEQHGSSGSVHGPNSARDGPPHSSGSHVSFSSRPNSSGSGEQGDGHNVHGGEGFGRGLAGKSSSTTSSAAASDFGSGPSSPLTSNVTSANAILSNPSSSNGFKGFSVLSLPVTSPSAAVVAACQQQQHQYFSSSHHQHGQQGAAHHLASSLYSKAGSGTHPHDLSMLAGSNIASQHEDDRSSVRSRTSTYRGADNSNDVYSAFVAGGAPFAGGISGGGACDQGIYSMSMASASNTHLMSDSLVRRLEELQQQDHDLEEKQRIKEREKERDKDKENKGKTTKAQGQGQQTQSRPSALSRANSGASTMSHASHAGAHRPPSSHGSGTGAGAGIGGSSSGGTPSTHGSGMGNTGSGPASTGKSAWEDDHEPPKRLKNRLGLGQGL